MTSDGFLTAVGYGKADSQAKGNSEEVIGQ